MNATTVIVAAALIALVGTVVAAALTFTASKRMSSGNIETSDASTLWAASETIRLEMRAELVLMREQVKALLAKIDLLERRLAEYEELAK